MKTLNEIADFLENGIIECEENTGCGRCDEIRKCVLSLRSSSRHQENDISSIDKQIQSMPTGEIAKWICDNFVPKKEMGKREEGT